jgi:hypothetical protein
MSFALDPQVAEAPPPAAARPSANSRQPSSAFSGGRRLLK